MNNTISIVVPVYNCEKYLEKCLDSILASSYGDLEILLINDGSTDGSDEICNRYAKQDEWIKGRGL
jgi:glycosyltransferase involved in cell wall biosynthesis